VKNIQNCNCEKSNILSFFMLSYLYNCLNFNIRHFIDNNRLSYPLDGWLWKYFPQPLLYA